MRKSRIHEEFEFNEDVYIVSILNINTGDGLQKIMGHSTLLVEGLSPLPGAGIATNTLFVGQYDLLGDDQKGVVSQIRVFEKDDYQRDYKDFPAVSYYVGRIKALEMIASIKKDAERVGQQGEKIPFEMVQLLRGGDSYNCTKWCYEKLKLCGIDITGKPKPKVAAGDCVLI